MAKELPTKHAIGRWLLNHRWWLVGLASLSVFSFEFLEYQLLLREVEIGFFIEIFFYGVVLPFATGMALSWLAALTFSTYYQDLKHNLNMQLYNANSYPELAEVFLQFVRVIMPLIGATFYRYDDETHNYKLITVWSLNKDPNCKEFPGDCDMEHCPSLPVQPGNNGMALHSCEVRNQGAFQDAASFCIPFLFSNTQIAVACLYFAHGSSPSPEQARLLKEIAPEIASAFQRVKLENLVKYRNERLTVEQQRIARDVHDTLGQSLAYLRLRLDHISMEVDQTSEGNGLRQEVENLRDVAKEAYDQMRNVLTVLSPDTCTDLNSVLMNYADKICERAGLQLNFNSEGKTRALPALIQRNVFYLFQETLANVEKHAHARQVNVDVKWGKNSLEIAVVDDGVGYDPAALIPNGHFGLKNMRERALESNGQLLLSSQPGRGTRLILRIPLEDET